MVVLNIHWKDWCWSWSSNTLATWSEGLTHRKRPWCWERSKAGGEGDNKGQDGWMASAIQWTWVWASSGRWWRTGKPGVLQSMASELGMTEQQWHSIPPCWIPTNWFLGCGSYIIKNVIQTFFSLLKILFYFFSLLPNQNCNIVMVMKIFMFMRIPLSFIIKDYTGCSIPRKCEKKIPRSIDLNCQN